LIGIIDYGLGNLRSIAGAVTKVGFEPLISSDALQLAGCEKLILPGVGAFRDGMNNLNSRGLTGALTELVVEEGKPLLGICLGSQLITNSSDEFGHHKGLGWIDANVRRLAPIDSSLPIPHVGWNDLFQEADSILLADVPPDALFYYVHSYHVEGIDFGYVIGTCDYGCRFVAAYQRDNIYATQFHPEKSQLHGLRLLENFLSAA